MVEGVLNFDFRSVHVDRGMIRNGFTADIENATWAAIDTFATPLRDPLLRYYAS